MSVVSDFFSTTAYALLAGNISQDFSINKLHIGSGIDMNGGILDEYTIAHLNTGVGGNITLDYEVAQSRHITLTANTTITAIDNTPVTDRYAEMKIVVSQNSTGGYTLAWPASIQWARGTAPVITPDIDATDIVHIFTVDGGTSWFGTFIQDFS